MMGVLEAPTFADVALRRALNSPGGVHYRCCTRQTREQGLELTPVKREGTYSTYRSWADKQHTHQSEKTHQEANVKKTSRGVDFSTKVPREGVRVKLASYEFHGAEDDSQVGQSHTYLSISRGQFIQRFGLKQLWLLRPIQGEAIQGCGVVFGATHPEELAFPPLVRVLEKGEEYPASDSGKAYPKAFPLLLHFKEMKEDVHGGQNAQVPAVGV